jgi:hypothetical protein
VTLHGACRTLYSRLAANRCCRSTERYCCTERLHVACAGQAARASSGSRLGRHSPTEGPGQWQHQARLPRHACRCALAGTNSTQGEGTARAADPFEVAGTAPSHTSRPAAPATWPRRQRRAQPCGVPPPQRPRLPTPAPPHPPGASCCAFTIEVGHRGRCVACGSERTALGERADRLRIPSAARAADELPGIAREQRPANRRGRVERAHLRSFSASAWNQASAASARAAFHSSGTGWGHGEASGCSAEASACAKGCASTVAVML